MSFRHLVAAFLSCFIMLHFSIAHADQAPTKKKWTLMIFLNGNNDLDDFGKANIKAMETVGSNDDMNIVVQWASKKAGTVTRLYIQKSSNAKKINSPIIEDLGKVDMGNPESLEDFIAWTVEHYPAEHYFVDLWSHGTGWREKRVMLTSKNISPDELTGNTISTEQLGHVMARAALLMGHKVDIFGSDACLMGMAEVANEMSDSVQYFVGSQEEEPPQGWPYAQFLARWQSTQNASSIEIAKILSEEFVKAYQPGGVYQLNDKVTFSAYDLSKLAALNKTLFVLGDRIRDLSPSARTAVIERSSEVQTFAYPDYADLIDFMKILSEFEPQGLSTSEINDVIKATKAMVIANNTSPAYARATGLSIWLPTNNYIYKSRAERYRRLRFSMNTQWNNTLGSLLQGVHND